MNIDTKKGEVTSDGLHTNADENQSKLNFGNEELIYNKREENSIFNIVGTEEKGYFAAFNNYRLTEKTKTIEEARNLIEKQKWNITLNLIAIVCELRDKGIKHENFIS